MTGNIIRSGVLVLVALFVGLLSALYAEGILFH